MPFVSVVSGRMASSVSGAWILFWENSLKAYYLHECFLKWWYRQNTPKMIIFSRKTMVVEYHHFRKPPHMNSYHKCFFLTFFFRVPYLNLHFVTVAGTVDGSEIRQTHQLYMVNRPIICRVLYIPSGWPWDFWTINRYRLQSLPMGGPVFAASENSSLSDLFISDRWGWLNPLKKITWTHHSKKVTSRTARELLDLLIDLKWFPGSRCHHQSFCESFLRHHQSL